MTRLGRELNIEALRVSHIHFSFHVFYLGTHTEERLELSYLYP